MLLRFLPKAQAFHEQDEAKAIAFSKGEVDLSWVDKSLADKGFDIIDDVLSSIENRGFL